jgi:hypothetical protein
MSIYDSTHSASGDSRATKRAKSILQKAIKEQLKPKGFKVVGIKEESPAFFDKPYHADLAVLVRSVEQPDFYSFFIVEIDSKLGHRTALKDRRDDERAMRFIQHNGIRTVRFNLEEIVGADKLSEFMMVERIWIDAMMRYVMPLSQHDIATADNNINFAIKLKENAFTKCRGCDHAAALHNLNGCDFKQTNKQKLRCHCNEPVFRSDS